MLGKAASVALMIISAVTGSSGRTLAGQGTRSFGMARLLEV